MTAIIITLVSTVAIGASLLLNNLNHEILFEIVGLQSDGNKLA